MQAVCVEQSGSCPVDRERRFGGMTRLYGGHALGCLAQAHVCVAGIGGVGSWAAEALARSGVGAITLIDLDNVAESNINRQIQALENTLGQAKVDAMRTRIALINPECAVTTIEDFVEPENAMGLLNGFSVVIDAVDSVRAKVAMIMACRVAGTPLIVSGAAGGKTDPGAICVSDLARTEYDPLLAKVRRKLRSDYGFTRDPCKQFGIPAVYSTEPLRYPEQTCVSEPLQGLACAGYGSSVMVTASFGFFAASRALDCILRTSGGG